MVAQSVAARVLYGTGCLKWFARAALLEAAANVALSLFLCSRYGLVGVAIGVAVPNLLMCLWVISHTLRGMRVSMASYLAESWLRPVIAAMVPLTVWGLGDWRVDGWLSLGTALAAGLVLYGAVVVAIEGRFPLMRMMRVPTVRHATG